MKETNREERSSTIPKGRKKHHPYDESVDEPAKLIEDEAVEIEEEGPAEENEPVEQVEDNDEVEMPAFEQREHVFHGAKRPA